MKKVPPSRDKFAIVYTVANEAGLTMIIGTVQTEIKPHTSPTSAHIANPRILFFKLSEHISFAVALAPDKSPSSSSSSLLFLFLFSRSFTFFTLSFTASFAAVAAREGMATFANRGIQPRSALPTPASRLIALLLLSLSFSFSLCPTLSRFGLLFSLLQLLSPSLLLVRFSSHFSSSQIVLTSARHCTTANITRFSLLFSTAILLQPRLPACQICAHK
mmetsp:Transcript_39273/g.100660  ORF Transcript_39273/g.100660 Transcript_39273/m.100660 type:complete len:218 (-) Transcript_39273:15-668(-)